MMEGNIIDYLEWRGDITLGMSPFNEVDNLILAELIYADIDKLIPTCEDGGYITMSELGEKFMQTHRQEDLDNSKSLIANCYKVLLNCAKSERFKRTKLYKFRSVIDAKKEMQFAAVHMHLDDDTVYVAFRGTDDSLVGWKENFNMSYKIPVPSQEYAAKYLNETMDEPCMYRIGGHSKGGNLAVYAAVKCNALCRAKIVHVYSNDGPGFVRDIPECPEYQAMSSYITTIVPESSVIGMLMEHSENYVIVKSDLDGIYQHDGMSWKLVGTKFCTLECLNKDSILADETITNWLIGIDDDKREEFVDAVYGIVLSTGAKKLSEFNSPMTLLKLDKMLKQYNTLDSETQAMVHAIINKLKKEAVHSLRRDVNEKIASVEPPLLIGKK